MTIISNVQQALQTLGTQSFQANAEGSRVLSVPFKTADQARSVEIFFINARSAMPDGVNYAYDFKAKGLQFEFIASTSSPKDPSAFASALKTTFATFAKTLALPWQERSIEEAVHELMVDPTDSFDIGQASELRSLAERMGYVFFSRAASFNTDVIYRIVDNNTDKLVVAGQVHKITTMRNVDYIIGTRDGVLKLIDTINGQFVN